MSRTGFYSEKTGFYSEKTGFYSRKKLVFILNKGLMS